MKLVILVAAAAIVVGTSGSAGPPAHRETAVLAGGCYWGMQEVFEHVNGVTSVTAGFAGGSENGTEHAEAVKIAFDPSRISYDQLLQIYFTVAHDPTEVDRQGPDVGPSYRSAIFPQSPQQARIARASIANLTAMHVYDAPIATKIEYGGFSPAEPDQQDFADKHPDMPYIVINDVPKVKALKNRFPNLWKA